MIVSVILTIIAAVLKAKMDHAQFTDIDSWRNKWKNGDPKQGEKFPFSSTIFVMFTDRWHLTQSFFLTAIFCLVTTYQVQYSPIIDFVILRVIFGATFETFYRYLKQL